MRSQPAESAVQRDLDRVRLRALELGDLSGREIGAVAERDELAIAGLETGHRSRDLDSADRVILEVAVVGGVQVLG